MILALVVIVSLTSGAMALARGQMTTAGTLIICTGTGPPVSVQVDADGQPVGRVHICPDCALGLFAAISATTQNILEPAMLASNARQLFYPALSPYIVPRPVQARAPPIA